MQTLSSARRTCIASASAVEWTATVAMPISLQARLMRSAISPRLAMRIFSNMSADDDEGLSELDGLRILDADVAYRSGARRDNGIHRFHRFDDQKRVAFLDRVADFHEGRLTGLRRHVTRAPPR